jgi:hypothetical protein
MTIMSPMPKRQKTVRDYVIPSVAVLTKLGDAEQICLAFWVETTQECQTRKGFFDQAGLYSTSLECGSALLVRIGWAIGAGGSGAVMKERIVRPRENHEIQAAAAAHHGVTNDVALTEGVCIKMALEAFMTDVLAVAGKGGRILGHHLSYHGTIIANELSGLSMQALQTTWSAILKDGLCLMDPVIGRYARESCLHERCSQKTSENALTFEAILQCLMPDYAESQLRAATPLENAAVCLRLRALLHELTLPPCRRFGGQHQYVRVFPGGMRDNGEWTEECALCHAQRI